MRVIENDLQSLKHLILDKTEGKPFFMEEIVQELAEQGLIGVHGHAPLPTDIHIPATVQAVLASRIDRLSPEDKELLQTLAVIGKEFSFGLLKRVVEQSEDTLQKRLSHLRDAEFIYEQPAFPEPDYVFKHALTQEVAYNSMLIERRKVLHERAAQAIEAIFHNRLDDHYSELASHYSRSGNTQKAVDYLHLAGQQAVQRSANTEAVMHLTTALDLLKTQPDTGDRPYQELQIQLALGPALMIIKGYTAPEVEQLYIRARKICQQVGEMPQLFPVLWGLWIFYMVRANLQAARELGEQLLRLAQNVQDPPLLVKAHFSLGETLLVKGDFVLAQAHLEQSYAFYNPQNDHSLVSLSGFEPGIISLSWTAWILWMLGYPEQALESSQEALTLAQKLNHPSTLTFALVNATSPYQLRQEPLATQERAEAAIALAAEQGNPVFLAHGTIMRGWALTKLEQTEEGITQLQQGISAWQRVGAKASQDYWLGLLAESQGEQGQTYEGLATVAEALSFAGKTGSRFYEAELYRLKGELTLQKETRGWGLGASSSTPQASSLRPQVPSGVVQEAEACFLKALEVSRKQQAKSLELRAAMSLARLWRQQGKRDKARALLSEIYNWFTEGFDTKDLQEAKALLEELDQKTVKRQSKKPRKRSATQSK